MGKTDHCIFRRFPSKYIRRMVRVFLYRRSATVLCSHANFVSKYRMIISPTAQGKNIVSAVVSGTSDYEEVKTALFRNRDVQQRKNKDLRRQILVLAPVKALSPLLPGDSAHKYHAPWRAQSPKYRAGQGKQMLISGIFSVYRQPTEYQSVWPDGRSCRTLNTFEYLPKKHRPSSQ